MILLHIISEIEKGKSPSKIQKESGIKKTTFNHYLRELKESGAIEKVGYGTWEIKKKYHFSTKARQTKRQIRGHAFTWRIKLSKEIDWIKRLEKFKINYNLVGWGNSTPRIIFNGKKIWLTKKGMVIYESKSFYSRSSFQSKGRAVWEMDQTIKKLGRFMQINLGEYRFTTSREHYGQIKNELARQYNDRGEKLFIRDDEGIWMWIDDSHSLNELETNDPKNSRGVQGWYNDMKKTNFEVTPTFIMNSINQVTQNQLMFNQNFESHVEAIKTLSSTVKELREEIKRLRGN